MLKLVDEKNDYIFSAWELYLKMDDLSDFIDTLNVILSKTYR